MTYQELSFTTVAVGVVDGDSTSVTTEVIVPFLRNSIEIPCNGELLMQVDEVKPTKRTRGRNWKDDVTEERKKAPTKDNAESSLGMIDI